MQNSSLVKNTRVQLVILSFLISIIIIVIIIVLLVLLVTKKQREIICLAAISLNVSYYCRIR